MSIRDLIGVLGVVLVRNCLGSTELHVGVLEHNPVSAVHENPSHEEALVVMMSNLDFYYNAVVQSNGAELIVFPEYGLFGVNFTTRDSILPFLEEIPSSYKASNCAQTKWASVLQRTSCIAQSTRTFLVLDMGEVQWCFNQKGCPEDGRYQFNTAVVFSDSGELVAKYRKTNLWGETYYDAGEGEPVSFKLPSGIEVGILICFDIMWEHPQFDLYSKGIDMIAFPTWWLNSPPQTAVQVQQGASLMNNITLLASNGGSGCSVSGSGIYSRGNVVTSFWNRKPSPEDKLLLGSVSTTSQYLGVSHEITRNYSSPGEPCHPWPDIGTKSVIYTEPGSNVSWSATMSTLQCNATLQANNASQSSAYILVAYVGTYPSYPELHIETCSLHPCANADCSFMNQNPEDVIDIFYISGSFSSSVFWTPEIATSGLNLVTNVSNFGHTSNSFFSTQFQQPLSTITLFGVDWSQ
ncbi:biotinidase precursor [Pelomyxa schiedti]|nr:biotinidase precursor [Pelomyxa schiedti]